MYKDSNKAADKYQSYCMYEDGTSEMFDREALFPITASPNFPFTKLLATDGLAKFMLTAY